MRLLRLGSRNSQTSASVDSVRSNRSTNASNKNTENDQIPEQSPTNVAFKMPNDLSREHPLPTIRPLRQSSVSSMCSLTEVTFLSEEGIVGEDGQVLHCRASQIAHRRRWEIQDSVLDCIGQTPIIKLNRMAPSGVNVYIKCENLNPGGSLKDRLAAGIIEWAEHTGKLKPGMTVVEASSGNTGVGLALVCAAKGYPFVCCMSEAFSVERRKIMRFLGARVILTPKENKATGMLIKAQELADEHGFFYTKQFENEANAWMHEQTTGREIADAFERKGEKLNHFFMAYGSGGTVLGVSRALKKRSPDTKIHLCEPSNAPMVKSGIPTRYPKSGVPSTSFDSAHPVWNPHVFQGWATDFIPKLISIARQENGFDTVKNVKGNDAIWTSQQLAREEGIFCGISGGGILSAALKFAETAEPGTNILAVITDTGERYLSTALFEDIPAEMTAEEKKLAASTVGKAPPLPPGLSGFFPSNTDELFDL